MKEQKILSNEEFYLWEKEIDVVHLTGWICEEKQQDIDEITGFFIKVMKDVGKINDDFITENFGLDTRTSKKLLHSLERNHPEIILSEKTNGIKNYFLKEGDSVVISEDTKTMIQSRIKSYSIILNPLFFINRRLRTSIPKSKLPQAISEIVISALIQLNRIIMDESEKETYLIPHEIKELILDKVYVRGLGKGTLQQQHNSFRILFNNWEYYRIRNQHPSYALLYDELKKISNDTDSINNSINQWLEKHVSKIDFETEVDISSKKLIVRTSDSQTTNFGILFNFYRNNNGKAISFQIKNGWALQIPVEIIITDSKMNKLFNYFNQLDFDLDEDYSKVLVEKNKEFEDRLIKTWTNETNLAKGTLIKQLRDLTKNNVDEWFYHILARLQEGSIFE